MPRTSREGWKTWGDVFDEFTLRTIFKLAGRGHFEHLESPVAVGKESNVFTARTKDKGRVIVKIYRLEVCDFNKMFDYLKYDPRYSIIKKNRRKIIFSWVQREFRNLMKAREGNVSVPKPITFMNNIILEEFIGDENAAPQVKDLHPKNKQDFAKKIILNMKRLYNSGLVHADLSQFNILNYNENPVLIDFSQTTTISNQRAEEFLERDIRNIVNFFAKLGLRLDAEKVKKEIIGKL